MNKALRYLIYGQISFLAFIVICFVLRPDAFRDNEALSYYGTNLTTILPYALGILLASFFMLKSAANLNGDRTKVIRISLRAMAFLLVAMLFVPYHINDVFLLAHLAITLLLLLVVLAASFYIVGVLDRRPLNIFIISLELFAVAMLFLSLAGTASLHGLSELLMSLLFIALMYNTLKDFKEHPHNTTLA